MNVKKAWRTNLAELFHQLYVFLPISPLDEMKDRLIRVATEMGPNEDGMMIPKVVEVMMVKIDDAYLLYTINNLIINVD